MARVRLKKEIIMKLVTICSNCGSRFAWDNELWTEGIPDCPACGFNNQTGRKGMGKKEKKPQGLAGALLDSGSSGDDAVEEVLTLARQGDKKSLALVEEALEFLAGKKLTYFTPGPRVMAGEELDILVVRDRIISKATERRMFENVKETQNDIMLLFHNYPSDDFMTSMIREIKIKGGYVGIKAFQLLLTHAQVQSHLISIQRR
jgi:predicted  nucleic acid-binding Zn-ribbon protein